MIEVRDLHFAYAAGGEVLKGLTLSFGAGEVVNILGPNGCGKTTLLKLMLGFLPAPPGSVLVEGRDIRGYGRRELARRLAYVPQAHHGVFNYTALDMVLMGRTAASPWLRFSDDDQRRAGAALERVRISHLAGRHYLQLSGGERQLVLIARALAQNSAFLIMDEPAGGLDYGHQFHLLKLIRELADDGGPGFVLTTHHPEQAVYLGGRALMIKAGLLTADGPAAEIIDGRAVRDLYDLPPEFSGGPASAWRDYAR
ncbi:MAG: ABC transporter ATP-binding protein [Candidatus Adiutrix sp.]|jgi:iron complex transport system ATP-binding protein|nr:ABC transporter ATP-binding protein [Candidatus Adiutrix sp.]